MCPILDGYGDMGVF